MYSIKKINVPEGCYYSDPNTEELCYLEHLLVYYRPYQKSDPP